MLSGDQYLKLLKNEYNFYLTKILIQNVRKMRRGNSIMNLMSVKSVTFSTENYCLKFVSPGTGEKYIIKKSET